jgi:hypothetical protein
MLPYFLLFATAVVFTTARRLAGAAGGRRLKSVRWAPWRGRRGAASL